MKGNKSFNLLEGTYEPKQARQLVLSCINEQIMILNRELLRRKIYGGDIGEVETAVDKLASKRAVILDLFRSEDLLNAHSLTLHGVIEVAV